MHFKFAARTLLLALASTSFTLSALAQWQWTDKDGRKVFSDRPPPAEIQEKNILKRPSGRDQAKTTSNPDGAAAMPTPAVSVPFAKASAPLLSGKDALLEARKKQAEDEQEAKKRQDEEKAAKVRADNCERAKKGLAGIQSGIRIAVTNAKGEREVMDDNARAVEAKRLQAITESDCAK